MGTYTCTRYISVRDMQTAINQLDPSVSTLVFIVKDGTEVYTIVKPT
jgi:hypothetical protein